MQDDKCLQWSIEMVEYRSSKRETVQYRHTSKLIAIMNLTRDTQELKSTARKSVSVSAALHQVSSESKFVEHRQR